MKQVLHAKSIVVLFFLQHQIYVLSTFSFFFKPHV